MAKRKIRKTTPEERARWRENHECLQRIIERRLEEEAARAAAGPRKDRGA